MTRIDWKRQLQRAIAHRPEALCLLPEEQRLHLLVVFVSLQITPQAQDVFYSFLQDILRNQEPMTQTDSALLNLVSMGLHLGFTARVM